MRNNMSDWDAKKAFIEKYLHKNTYMPQIYIDDYLNYYIEDIILCLFSFDVEVGYI